MKEYLNMSDVFDGIVNVSSVYGHILYTGDIDDDGSIDEHAAAFNETSAKYLAHAINSHDELVAEVELLRESLSELMDWTLKNAKAEDCSPYNAAHRLLNR